MLSAPAMDRGRPCRVVPDCDCSPAAGVADPAAAAAEGLPITGGGKPPAPPPPPPNMFDNGPDRRLGATPDPLKTTKTHTHTCMNTTNKDPNDGTQRNSL